MPISLKYILKRYADMRGTYFAKHLKGTANSNINKVVDSQATRTRVMNDVACSKNVGKLKKRSRMGSKRSNYGKALERMLWLIMISFCDYSNRKYLESLLSIEIILSRFIVACWNPGRPHISNRSHCHVFLITANLI